MDAIRIRDVNVFIFLKNDCFFRFPIVFCFVFWSFQKLSFFKKVLKRLFLKGSENETKKTIGKRKKRSFNDRFQKRLTTLIRIHEAYTNFL